MATYKTRIPSCFLLLVTAFVLMAFQGFHKIRDGRLSNDIISEKIAEIESLREQLQVPKSLNFVVFYKFFFNVLQHCHIQYLQFIKLQTPLSIYYLEV